MAKKALARKSVTRLDEAQPNYEVEYKEIQAFGTLKCLPIALEDNARSQSVAVLNQVLADTMTLRDLYKKHHWQMSGATFYQLHLLLDKHYEPPIAAICLFTISSAVCPNEKLMLVVANNKKRYFFIYLF